MDSQVNVGRSSGPTKVSCNASDGVAAFRFYPTKSSEPCHFFRGGFARQEVYAGTNPQQNPCVIEDTDK